MSSDPDFAHLHVHSYYSFLDSVLSPADIVSAAVAAGARAVAITDTNCMSGVVEFIKAAEEAGIHPVIGAEIRQPFMGERMMLRSRKSVGGIPPLLEESENSASDDSGADMEITSGASHASQSASPALCHGDPKQRAVLLAKNLDGYSEISRIATRRMLDSEFDLFRELRCLSGNVIVLTDCVSVLQALGGGGRAGDLPYAILIPSRARRRQNRSVYECACRMNLPMVITCDVKLATAGDRGFHTLLQAMRRLATVHHITSAEQIDPAQHFQSAESVRDFFGIDTPTDHADARALHEAVGEAFANTGRIAGVCQCRLPLGVWKFPRLADQTVQPVKMLRELVYNGLAWRYGKPLREDVVKRADYELSVIENNHFTDYFLLVHRIVAEAHARRFFIVGRGSAANSIVSYSLGITNVCPIKHDLYFERFLNPERSVPPDIDIDFSWKERDEIIQWCFDFFGQNHVALISTIQTFRSRQAVREVAKAYGISESEVNQFSQLKETGYRMEEPVGGNAGRRNGGRRKVHDLSKMEPWRTVLQTAQRLHGFPRHFSVHCGGIVITPTPVTDWVALTRSAKGYAVTQYDMYSAEDLGLIKIDLLGNRSLGVLKDAITQAQQNVSERAERADGPGGETVEDAPDDGTLSEINTSTFQREAVRMKMTGTRRGTTVALAGVLQNFVDSSADDNAPAQADSTVEEQVFNFSRITSDTATRAMIDKGRTMGCFYIESPGMRALFERLRCQKYEDVVAASSIIRPGVAESGMMQEYITRHKTAGGKRHMMPTVLPLMQQVLPETYGVMVYQEDVLRVAHRVAGLSYGQADLLRRAMSGKHRSEEGIAKLEGQFMCGAMERGLSEHDAREIWRQIASFAGYSFCKGHSAAFAVLSYQIAWLKAHHPAEFFAGLLTNQGGFYGPEAYLQEARRWGMTVDGPCVNESDDDYTGKGKRVRVGLLAIQNLSVRSREIIISERYRGGRYTSPGDFLRRTNIGNEECRVLIKAGALDAIADPTPTRRAWQTCARIRPAMLLQLAAWRKQPAMMEDNFFDCDSFFESFSFREQPHTSSQRETHSPTPFTLQELYAYETEIMGFSLSAHPLELASLPPDIISGSDIRKYNKQRIRMAGVCIAAKLLTARNCGRPMKMLTLEDLTDTFEAILFPRIYERYAPRTLTRGPYIVEGLVDMSLGSPTLNVEKIETRLL